MKLIDEKLGGTTPLEIILKFPKKEKPNVVLKLISYLDSSAKLMVPELGILMQTDTSYAEDLLGIKFKPARDSIKDAGNSVIRLGLV